MCFLQVVIKVPQIAAAVTWLGLVALQQDLLHLSRNQSVFPQSLAVARGAELSLERGHGAGSACSLCPGSDQKPLPFAALLCGPSKPADGQDQLSWLHQDLPRSWNSETAI